MVTQINIFGEAEESLHPLEILATRKVDPSMPVVVAYGGGKNSTAMLVLMWRLGIKPDLILFADTGGELPETYEYMRRFNRWLASVGMPEIVTVRRSLTGVSETRRVIVYAKSAYYSLLRWGLIGADMLDAIAYVVWLWAVSSMQYETLEQHALITQTLPSVAYNKKACSKQWKVEPQEEYITQWKRDRGYQGKVRKFIGIHSGELRRIMGNPQKLEDKDCVYEYPLITHKLDDWGCVQLISAVGLPVPPKSSCFFCPNRRVKEVMNLPTELKMRGMLIETVAMSSPGWRGEAAIAKGLGRTFAWRDIGAMTELEMLAVDFRKESRMCGCME